MNKFDDLVFITKSIIKRESFPSLRGVAVDWKDNIIMIYFYNDGPISEELENDFFCVGTEVIAQYDVDIHDIHEHIKRVDGTKPLPSHPYWAYLNPHTLHTSLFPVVSTENIYLVHQTKELMEGQEFLSLRGLAVRWKGKEIALDIYYNGTLSEEMKNQYSQLAEKMSQRNEVFDNDHHLKHAVVNWTATHLDALAPLPFHEHWVYKNPTERLDFP